VESLSLLYRKSLAELEQLTGRKINRLHIVGGGTRNDLLNQCAASATGRRVITGPVEATAAGNILIQALAGGAVSSLAEARGIVGRSFPRTLTNRRMHPSGKPPTSASRLCREAS